MSVLTFTLNVNCFHSRERCFPNAIQQVNATAMQIGKIHGYTVHQQYPAL